LLHGFFAASHQHRVAVLGLGEKPSKAMVGFSACSIGARSCVRSSATLSLRPQLS
jgi:hypothetical protein